MAPDGGSAVASLPGNSAAAQQAAMIETEAGRMMEIARVNGQVQARSIERIGEIVKENPGATATIIRQWIHEAG
jgi:flagellar M-ring protein FliF